MAVVEPGPGSDSGLVPGFGSPEIQNAAGIRAVLNTLFLFSIVCNYPCGVHSPCGTRSIWCYLWRRDLTSSVLAILRIVRSVLRAELATLRPLGV